MFLEVDIWFNRWLRIAIQRGIRREQRECNHGSYIYSMHGDIEGDVVIISKCRFCEHEKVKYLSEEVTVPHELGERLFYISEEY